MAYSTRYVEPCNCIMLSFSGAVTAIDILDAVRELPHYLEDGKQINGIISDYSEVSEFNVYADGVRQVADSTISLSKNLLDVCVAVVAPQPVIFGSSRMWEVFTSESGWKSETFKTREAAESWLKKNIGSNKI